MRLQPTETGFTIDAADLGPLLGLAPSAVPGLMRDGRITSLSEEGRDADAGRFRVTFRHGAVRLRLTIDSQGTVISQSRITTTPPPGPRQPKGKTDDR